MNNLWKWLTRQRNACCVTYTRFGVPGDVVDDRPQPSVIYVAPFDVNNMKFIFFKLCHAQKAALAVAGFGISAVVLIFISAFFEFDWYNHRTGIDIIALAFLFLYLGVGILVHYQVIIGIRKQISHYLLPFIIAYIIAIGIELLFTFLYVLHLQSPALDYEFKEEANGFYLFSIIVLLVLIVTQGFMLAAICQCRYYLSCKEIHTTALKVAENSRTKYPGIQVVFASPATFSTNCSVDVHHGNGLRTNDAVTEQNITTAQISRGISSVNVSNGNASV